MAEFRLETERLILRDWQSGDFEALHALCTCPQVMATIGPLHDEEKTRGLLGRLQERTQLHGHTFWAMECKDDRRVIGFCGVSRGPVPPIEGLLEIGWRMAADCWGQGYAREAAQETLRWIAANRPGDPVSAITSAGNVRSRRLMERPHVTYWLESVE